MSIMVLFTLLYFLTYDLKTHIYQVIYDIVSIYPYIYKLKYDVVYEMVRFFAFWHLTFIFILSSLRCFKSGDVRVNEHIGLASMHQLFVREHNRIAEVLGDLNSHWNDEQVFQEARRIVGAELQHIVFTEFLPSVLGQVSDYLVLL